MEVFSDLVLITVVVAILGQNGQSSLLQSASAASDPTAGFHEVKLSEHNFKIQRPYDVPISKRYSFKDGVRKLWVYGNDKGHSPGNRTPPRTEIRIQVCRLDPMILLLVLVKFINQIAVADEDPTKGFTEVPLKPSNFVLQKPYDVPLDKRYSFVDGVHRMWVYSDDKPFNPSTHTMPRTEIRIAGLDYSSGVWQFEGEGYVPRGTSGATVAQIHGASHGATTLILRIYAPGEMRYYNSLHVADGMYDRWFKLNIVHDVDGGTVTVYLDGEKKFQHHDQGPGDLYFKCGVYGAPSGMSHYMESRWKNIKIYKK
ncbi:Citrate-binding protein [Linum grandiflorum]